MNKFIIRAIIPLLFLVSCTDFLKEQSQDLTYATSCQDLDELLVGGGYMKHIALSTSLTVNNETTSPYFPWIHVMDDDSEELVYGALGGRVDQPREVLGAFHRWEKDPCNIAGVYYDDVTWKRLYKHVGVLNVIIEKADEFTDDSEEDRSRVKGESYFLRAVYHYLLVNFYAKPYSGVSASTDMGIPMKLTTHVEDKDWSRSPVDSVYHQIVADLKEAIRCLSGKPLKSVHRAGENAARVMLSRVYCYMGMWELVPGLCDEVIKKAYSLVDLNDPASVRNGLTSLSSPETIFTQGRNNLRYVFMGGQASFGSSFFVSEDLMNSFQEGDQRPAMITYVDGSSKRYRLPQKWIYNQQNTEMVSDNFLIRLAEVYLNKAEALAMLGKESEAREVLQDLREKRIRPEFLDEISYSGEELMNFIREERRRELCFEGHRWFDLRRYAVSPKYPEAKEIRHKYYRHTSSASLTPGVYQGYYLLRRYPNGGWVLPIPGYEIEKNDGKLINNEREDSNFLK